MAQAVHVLTVQDHLFINLQVSKKQHNWNFERLEEGVYYQYGYGKSVDVIGQAGRYATGFSRKSPFAGANVATGFVGLLTFLRMNGYSFELEPASAVTWWQQMRNAGENAKDRLAGFATFGADSHGEEIADLIQWVLTTYAEAITKMVEEEQRLAS